SELATAITMGETMDNAGIYNSTMDFKNLFK
ncbi:hypothetical protein LKX72_08605, partial [Campylobacter jejuni]|nr:hypothetical protein [Campylobacter jejuni]